MNMSTEHPPHHGESQSPDDVASFGDFIGVLWRQRVRVMLIVMGSLAIAATIIVSLWLLLPRDATLRLPLQTRFPGATDGRYPNGTPFQPMDIVSSSIIRTLYDRLKLDRFVEFDDLKPTLSAAESSQQIEVVRREFDAKLSNPKMTQAERNELEKEFNNRLRAARSGEIRLAIQYETAGLMQETAMSLLMAIPETWAKEAQKEHGAWLYDVAVPGEGQIDEASLKREDYLVAVDMLRLVLKRMDAAATRLESIPGANLVRGSEVNGTPGLSLVELRARLHDMQRFKLQPLLARIRALGVFRERAQVVIYLEDQLFRLDLDSKALNEKAVSVERIIDQLQRGSSAAPGAGDGGGAGLAGGAGSTIMPQFGEGFLDRLMSLGVKTADVEFRRELSKKSIDLRAEMVDQTRETALYKEMLNSLTAERKQSAYLSPEEIEVAAAQVSGRFEEIAQDARFLTAHLQGLHRVLSEQNLQPQRVFQVLGPVEQIRKPFGLKVIAGITALALLLGTVIAIISAFRREQARIA